MEKTVEQLQEEYALLLAKSKEINKQKKVIQDLVKAKGLVIKNGKIGEEETCYGVFFEFDYYSHFDGHRSESVIDYEYGSTEINEETFNQLKTTLQDYYNLKINIADAEEFLKNELDICVSEYLYDNFNIDFFEIINDNEIEWTYDGGGNQGELCDSSYATFKKTTRTKLNKVKDEEGTTYR